MSTEAGEAPVWVTIRGKSGAELLIKPARGNENPLDWLFRVADEVISDETRAEIRQALSDSCDGSSCCEHGDHAANGSPSE